MLSEVLAESGLQSDLAKSIYRPKNKSQEPLHFHIQMNGFGFKESTNQESQQDQN